MYVAAAPDPPEVSGSLFSVFLVQGLCCSVCCVQLLPSFPGTSLDKRPQSPNPNRVRVSGRRRPASRRCAWLQKGNVHLCVVLCSVRGGAAFLPLLSDAAGAEQAQDAFQQQPG